MPLLVPLGEPLSERLLGEPVEQPQIRLSQLRKRLGLCTHKSGHKLGGFRGGLVGGMVNRPHPESGQRRDILLDRRPPLWAQRKIATALETPVNLPRRLPALDQAQDDGFLLQGHSTSP